MITYVRTKRSQTLRDWAELCRLDTGACVVCVGCGYTDMEDACREKKSLPIGRLFRTNSNVNDQVERLPRPRILRRHIAVLTGSRAPMNYKRSVITIDAVREAAWICIQTHPGLSLGRCPAGFAAC